MPLTWDSGSFIFEGEGFGQYKLPFLSHERFTDKVLVAIIEDKQYFCAMAVAEVVLPLCDADEFIIFQSELQIAEFTEAAEHLLEEPV